MNFILKHFTLDKEYVEIHEGYSEDKKYIVTKENQQYLLRKINAKNRHKTSIQIDVAKQAHLYQVPTQKLIDIYFGTHYDYLLYEWIKGQNMYEVLLKFDTTEQYRLGVVAGQIHKSLHDIPCKKEIDWITFFNEKINRKLNMYKASPSCYPNDHLLIKTINEYRGFLTNKRISYLHGDFHAVNLILDKNQNMGVIDLNRAEYGDPYEEFLRITWDVERCTPFAKGRLDGYFDKKIPSEFWKLLKVYICSDLLTLLPWSYEISQEQVKIALHKYERVLNDYDDFKRDIPKWYR